MSVVNIEWVWIEQVVFVVVYDEQLVEYGGLLGVCDVGLLEFVLVWLCQWVSYGEFDVVELVVLLGFGIVCNYLFVDGNKCMVFVVIELFLMFNGYVFEVIDVECVLMMLDLVVG